MKNINKTNIRKLFENAVREDNIEQITAILRENIDNISSRKIERELKKTQNKDKINAFTTILKHGGSKLSPHMINKLLSFEMTLLKDIDVSPVLDFVHTLPVEIVFSILQDSVLSFGAATENKATSQLISIVSDKTSPIQVIFRAIACTSNKDFLTKIWEVAKPQLSDYERSLLENAAQNNIEAVSSILHLHNSELRSKVMEEITKAAVENNNLEIAHQMLQYVNKSNLSGDILQIELEEYHNTVESLQYWTCTDNLKTSKLIYLELLEKDIPIVSDILYTTSINKQHQIHFGTPTSDIGLRGDHKKGITTVYSTATDIPGTLIHEECHHMSEILFTNNKGMYDTENEKELFSDSIRDSLYNIFAKVYGEVNHDYMDKWSTWKIGQQLLLLKYDTTEQFYLYNILQTDAQIEKFKLQETLAPVFSLYEVYEEFTEDEEFMPRIPQILIHDQSQTIQEIFTKPLEYWSTVVTPKMNSYLNMVDHSDYCTPLPDMSSSYEEAFLQ